MPVDNKYSTGHAYKSVHPPPFLSTVSLRSVFMAFFHFLLGLPTKLSPPQYCVWFFCIYYMQFLHTTPRSWAGSMHLKSLKLLYFPIKCCYSIYLQNHQKYIESFIQFLSFDCKSGYLFWGKNFTCKCVKIKCWEQVQDEVIWIVTPCNVVVGYQRFICPCCLHFQGCDAV